MVGAPFSRPPRERELADASGDGRVEANLPERFRVSTLLCWFLVDGAPSSRPHRGIFCSGLLRTQVPSGRAIVSMFACRCDGTSLPCSAPVLLRSDARHSSDCER